MSNEAAPGQPIAGRQGPDVAEQRHEAEAVFAAAFAVALLEAEAEPELLYDEARQLNRMSDGRIAVEVRAGRTDTLTEVRGEQDDFDRPGGDDDRAFGLDTVTKVKREGDDLRGDLLLGTETRQLPGERDDFQRDASPEATAPDSPDAAAGRRLWARLETKTSVRREADDFATG